jgi:hypothetical protein
VKDGKLWLINGPGSFLGEELPTGTLTAAAVIQAPPQPIGPTELLPERLPAAWNGGSTTAVAVLGVLSQKAGKNLPWIPVRDAIDGAIRARIIERAPDSGPWPCEYSGASAVRLKLASGSTPPPPPPPPPPKPGTRIGEADLKPNQIQDLADVMGDLLKARAGCEIGFRLRVEVSGKENPPDAVITAINDVLKGVSKEMKVK